MKLGVVIPVVVLLFVSSVRSQDVLITEFMAQNTSTLLDDFQQSSDWIELFNPGTNDVNLAGWYLTDDRADLVKWRFPATNLPPTGFLVVFASGLSQAIPGRPLHTSFSLSRNGEYLALVRPDGVTIASEFFPTYPPQTNDVSYGYGMSELTVQTSQAVFLAPTPGTANAQLSPTFSLESGIYTNDSLTLTITAPSGSLILYTFDGSEPTASSLSDASPLDITFTTNMMIKARLFRMDQPSVWSPVRARTFVMLDESTRDFDSNLPILIISTQGRTIPASVPPDGSRSRGTFIALDTFRGRTSLQDPPDFQGLGQFEIFGQTSEGFAKKPYRIELNDELGNDRAASFLGLPAEADWNLRNPHNDKGFMNDFLGCELWEELGHYSCRRRYVEVFVDTAGGKLTYPGDYIGILVLFEHIEGGDNRVDIAELTPAIINEPAISGGYIIKKDKAPAGGYSEPTFNTTGGAGHSAQNLRWHQPKAREITLVQSNWIRNYLNLFEASMYSANWTNATGTNHYSHYIDVDAFVDLHWLVEFTKNIDGYRLNHFMHKDRGGKLKMGPIWDWDLSFGNANYLTGGMTNGWYWADLTSNEHIWLRRLVNGSPNVTHPVTANVPADGISLGDPDFRQKITDRWAVLREGALNGDHVLARIDELATCLAEASARNYAKYPGVLNTYQWPNPEGPPFHIDLTQPTYEAIVSEIKKWTKGRYLWIDGQFLRAPAFNANPGPVLPGFELEISAREGSVYYTLDGSDPRAPGGGIAPGALLFTGSVPLNANARIVARACKRPTSLWTPWSAPVAGTFIVEPSRLVITELMYHPPPTQGVTNVDEDFEYVEVKNIGVTPLDVNGFTLSGGIDFVFPSRTLAAGERVVVVNNRHAFTNRYGANADVIVAGEFSGKLGNDGDRLVLEGKLREPILDFSYDDDWYPITDGFGFALVVVDENAPAPAWNTKPQWRPSGAVNGSPGQIDPSPAGTVPVVVNEVLTHAEPPFEDAIELFNPTSSDADVSGWWLTDDFDTPKKFRIPEATIIPAGEFLAFDEHNFNAEADPPLPGRFNFAANGEEVYLLSADADGNLTGYIHGFRFGAAEPNVTFGRHITSIRAEHFVAQTSRTLFGANAGPRVGPVVISEIMYRPPDFPSGPGFEDNTADEFIELHNITDQAVALQHPTNTALVWRLQDAVDYAFPLGTVIAPHGYVLVVGFDPRISPARLASFRNRMGLVESLPVYGPWTGSLRNTSASVELALPVVFGAAENAAAYAVVDRVRFSNTAPWPGAADGMGHSLQRINPSAYGDDATNWVASSPTPGGPFVSGTLPTITQNPVDNTALEGASASFSGLASGPGPLRYRWRHDGDLIHGATNSVLALQNVQTSQAGEYILYALNPFGAAMSASATLTVLVGVKISQHPLSQTVVQGTNVTFAVIATTPNSPLSFQWRFNGMPISNATNASYSIAGVNEFNEGTYVVTCTDQNGAVDSAPATLRVLIAPQMVSPATPLNLTAVAGQTVTLSAVTRGTKPIWTVWRRFDLPPGTGGNIVRRGDVIAHTDFLTLTNIGTNAQGRYSMLMTNIAGGALHRPWTNAFLAVLADSDRDGIPDVYETANGGATGQMDPNADNDGDTMSNKAEYIAGTDPNDPASKLTVSPVGGAAAATLEFLAVSNRTYTVQFKDGLEGLIWTPLADIVSQATNRIEKVTDPASATNRFYRIVTPKVP